MVGCVNHFRDDVLQFYQKNCVLKIDLLFGSLTIFLDKQ